MEEKKGTKFYLGSTKIIVLCLQMLCVIVFGVGATMTGYLLSSAGNMEELMSNRSFEETDGCSRILLEKITTISTYMNDRTFFETNGEFDEAKTIDITNIAEIDPKKQNSDTTYTVEDLCSMAESGKFDQIAGSLEEAQYYSSDFSSEYSDQFEMLYEAGKLGEYELPISGVTLADYARENKESVSLVDLYQALCKTGNRLQEYLGVSDSMKDVGNIRYFIHNIEADTFYTNGEWGKDIDKAWDQANRWKLAMRYTRTPEKVTFAAGDNEGLRVVKNHLKNTPVSGNKEEVIFAVDTSYSEDDSLKVLSDFYNRYQPAFLPLLVMTVISFLLGMICFVIATMQAGQREKGGEIYLNAFDRIPTEVAAAIVFVAAGLSLAFTGQVSWSGALGDFNLSGIILTVCIMLLGAILFMWAYLSVVRRIKAKAIWKNSLCNTIINMCKKVYAARTSSRKMIIAFGVFLIAHVVLIGGLGGFGVFLILIADMLLLLYLIKEGAGRQMLREGLSYLAAGDLDYKIDVSNLQSDNLEMAEAVNRVGDGMQKAVEKSMKDERMRSELITNVSHDIKTPLTSIINYVDLLKREQIEDEKIKGYIDVLDAKSQRLKQLTEHLVEASKASSGNVELQMSKIQLQELLQQAHGEVDEQFKKKHLETIFTMVEDPVVIYADGRRLWRVLENLLNNIAKYALEGTRVYVDLRVINRKAVLMFKNISEQPLNINADELTERFTRGDSSRTTEGSGLGLSIAKSLTELQKGVFEIYLDGDLFKVTVSFDVMPAEIP